MSMFKLGASIDLSECNKNSLKVDETMTPLFTRISALLGVHVFVV